MEYPVQVFTFTVASEVVVTGSHRVVQSTNVLRSIKIDSVAFDVQKNKIVSQVGYV